MRNNMTPEEFMNLQPGKVVYDRRFNTYGKVKEGDWTNIGIISTLKGSGRYICWDDGDNSCVGLAIHTDQDIAHFELSDLLPT